MKNKFLMNQLKIYGIAYECPYYKRNENCFFYEKDYLSFYSKLNLIEDLCEKEINVIEQEHFFCLKSRENEVVR